MRLFFNEVSQAGKKARFGIVLTGAQEKWGQVNAAEVREGWRLS